MKKDENDYSSLLERIKAEYKIFILAFIFILIAELIGQVSVPLKFGRFILFPIFYSLIMGMASGPECFKGVQQQDRKIMPAKTLLKMAMENGLWEIEKFWWLMNQKFMKN